MGVRRWGGQSETGGLVDDEQKFVLNLVLDSEAVGGQADVPSGAGQ